MGLHQFQNEPISRHLRYVIHTGERIIAAFATEEPALVMFSYYNRVSAKEYRGTFYVYEYNSDGTFCRSIKSCGELA
jgi:hypothetical protein